MHNNEIKPGIINDAKPKPYIIAGKPEIRNSIPKTHRAKIQISSINANQSSLCHCFAIKYQKAKIISLIAINGT